MKSISSLIVIALLAITYARGQSIITPQKPRAYRYFENPNDSAAFEKLTSKFQEIYKNGIPAKEKMDSLSAEYEALEKKIKGLRYYYALGENFTPWETVKKESLYESVTRISFSASSSSVPLADLLKCKNLEAVELVNTRIKKLPKQLRKLPALHTLLSYDSKTNFKIRKNATLHTIVVRGGKMQTRFTQFRNLEKLDLSDCKLSTIPSGLHKNKKLKELLLNQNTINLTNIKIKPNNTIVKIELMQNNLAEVPDAIVKFPNLKSLVFNGNDIKRVTYKIGNVQKLEVLSFYKNQLAEIPEGVYALSNLKEIDLYYNQIEKLDDRISNLKNLEVLYLSNNLVLRVPESLGELPNLQELYLSNNRLSELPAGIASMAKLKVLRINNNMIIQVPKDLLKLISLENLDISSNQISELPNGLSQLASLKLLVLMNNPWDDETRKNLPDLAKALRSREVIVQVEEN